MDYRLISLLVVASVGLVACSSTPSCLKEQSYTKARAYPDLTIPPGLESVTSKDAMRVPSARSGPIARYKTAPANSDPKDPAAVCLTTPPPMPKSQVNMSKPAPDS